MVFGNFSGGRIFSLCYPPGPMNFPAHPINHEFSCFPHMLGGAPTRPTQKHGIERKNRKSKKAGIFSAVFPNFSEKQIFPHFAHFGAGIFPKSMILAHFRPKSTKSRFPRFLDVYYSGKIMFRTKKSKIFDEQKFLNGFWKFFRGSDFFTFLPPGPYELSRLAPKPWFLPM